MEWILQPEPCEPGPPAPIIEDLLTSAEFVHSDMPMVWLRRALILSEEVITNTALATKGQRNNPMWSIIRKNRITASSAQYKEKTNYHFSQETSHVLIQLRIHQSSCLGNYT